MHKILNKVMAGVILTKEEAYTLALYLLRQDTNYEKQCEILLALSDKTPKYQEFAGFLEAARQLQLGFPKINETYIDLAGTGGDNKHTFNISTISAFVVASCGVKVLKHGNFGFSSSYGSSNILEEFGIRFTADPKRISDSLKAANIGYIHAPLFNPAFANIAAARRAVGKRTIFNLLGPFLNPFNPPMQVIGAPNLDIFNLFTEHIQHDTRELTIVYTGSNESGYDEVSLTSLTYVANRSHLAIVHPKEFDLQFVHIDALIAEPQRRKQFIQLLSGEGSPAAVDVLAANAAIALRTANVVTNLRDGTKLAKAALAAKRPLKIFEIFCEHSI